MLYRNRFRIAENLRGERCGRRINSFSRALSFLHSPLNGTNKAGKYLGLAVKFSRMYFRVTVVDVIALLLMILSRNPLSPPRFVSRNVISIWWKNAFWYLTSGEYSVPKYFSQCLYSTKSFLQRFFYSINISINLVWRIYKRCWFLYH